ncbi:LPS export ABC transporter periplasmic protein LptC [Uliginosibacterium paludis]|uniref:LPS export ABC transporter periplasmic protein LptC n=1 Tax=Uliginosibacterium paludis TaxID=1615952 RepID=A0ABV2CUS0_9RHOO
MKRISSFFPVLIVALLAMASFWLEYVVRNENHGGLGNNRHDPDAIIHDFSVARFDAEGRKRSDLSADKLTHFPDTDTAELVSPRISFLQEHRTTTFTSDHGLADNHQRVVTLIGNVQGSTPAGADTPAQTLATDELEVLVDEEIGRTRHPISFSHGASELTGIGANWNNVSGQLDVLSHVRTKIFRAPKHDMQN